MNRRSFFRFLSVGALVAIAPLKFIAPALHARAVESLTVSEIVTTTLRKYAPQIAANVTRSSPLYRRLVDRGR
jgi:hypothetical protein